MPTSTILTSLSAASLTGFHWVLLDLLRSPAFLPTSFQSVAPVNSRVPPSSWGAGGAQGKVAS